MSRTVTNVTDSHGCHGQLRMSRTVTDVTDKMSRTVTNVTVEMTGSQIVKFCVNDKKSCGCFIYNNLEVLKNRRMSGRKRLVVRIFI